MPASSKKGTRTPEAIPSRSATLPKAWGHFCTITQHKLLVGKLCFEAGLYWQGITHDLSKYSPTEFMVGARYFQGDRSPNVAEREDTGVSTSWLHHKGRNKHHFEYWMDCASREDITFVGKPMPVRYVVEMTCDRIAACRVYQKERYTQSSALEYFLAQPTYNQLMHPQTAKLLEEMLRIVAQDGEREGLHRIHREYLR